MGQRIMRKKNRTTVKGVAIKKTSNKTGNNTIKVGNITIKNNGNGNSKNKKKRKIAVKRKK